MMRALLVLAGLFSASGSSTASCALHGAEAVDEMLDSAVYIMASIGRCSAKQNIRCALDVSSAIESVNAMVNVILKAVEKCGALKTKHHKCGLAVGVLTRSFAGLSAASAGIVAKCPNPLNGGKALATVGTQLQNAAQYGGVHASKTAGLSQGMGQYVINVKDVMKSLFKAIKRIMTVKHNCKDPKSKHCAHNSIKIVASFTALGEYLSGAIGQCTHNANQASNALCSQMSLRLFHHIQNVGRAAVNMGKHCEVTAAERLYLEDDEKATITPATGSGSVTLGLAALLPIAAVLGFVGGSRFAKSRSAPTRDCESLVEGAEVE